MKRTNVIMASATMAGMIVVLILTSLMLKQKCYSMWDDARYSAISGCLVNVDNEYIPEQNVRVIKWVYTEE